MSNDVLKQYLELLEKAEKESVKSDSSPADPKKDKSVEAFIKQYNIRAGTKRVHNFIVFFYYRQKFQFAPKLNRISFFRELSKYLPRARVGRQRYYLIDEGIFQIDREVKLEAKYYEQDYNSRSQGHRTRKEVRKYEKRKKKTQSEKLNEASRTEGDNESQG